MFHLFEMARRRPDSLGIECLEERRVPAVTWNVSFDDPGSANSAYYSFIRATLIAAGQDWSRFFPTANASIELTVEFDDLEDNISANAGNESSVFFRKNGKLEVWEFSVPHEIRTGRDSNGSTRDATITLDRNALAGKLWFDPTPANRQDEAVPFDKQDAYSLFLHELGHCLGFSGWRDWTSGKLPGKYESRFDFYVTTSADGTSYFNGPAAKAAYGGQPVPLTYSNLNHLGNDTFGEENGNGVGRPGSDLVDAVMSGTGQDWGSRTFISPLELAVLQDIGLPVSFEPMNTPPLLSEIENRTIQEDNVISVPVIVGDLNSPLDSLIVSVASDNATLLPTGSLTIDGAGTHRTLTIRPGSNLSGDATITVTVSDGSLTASDSLFLSVLPVYDLPTISPIDVDAVIITDEDVPATVMFTIDSSEVSLDKLSVVVSATNADLFPPDSLELSGSGAIRTLQIVPAVDQSNFGNPAYIDVTVSEGEQSSTQRFIVFVRPVEDLPTISHIDDQFIPISGRRELTYIVQDAETPANQLTYRAENSNPALIESLRVSVVGQQRTLNIVPHQGAVGTAVITVYTSDGQNEASQSFNVRVAEKPYPWRNYDLAFDVDNDGIVAPNDALWIIDRLNTTGSGTLPWKEQGLSLAPFYDVYADNVLSPNDALEVINYLNNRRPPDTSTQGAEGESADLFGLMVAMNDPMPSKRRGNSFDR